MQNVLYVPAIRDFSKRVATKPLTILCLPGRACRFLLRLIREELADVGSTTCIEHDPTEALLIRGKLAPFAKEGRPMIDIVRESAYSFLARDPRAVARRYHVIDLDPYGRLQDEIQTELIDSVAAAIAVQTRADVSDWLLLLQTEVASRRSLEGDLQAASAKMLEEHATALERNLSPDTITDDSPPAQLLRYSAGVAATLAECAFPHFVAKLEDRPVFYRGTDEYHVPSRRALMGAFTFRMTRPPLPSGSLGQRARAAKIAPIVDASVKRALRARAVVADEDGDAVVHATLDALNFEGSVGPD